MQAIRVFQMLLFLQTQKEEVRHARIQVTRCRVTPPPTADSGPASTPYRTHASALHAAAPAGSPRSYTTDPHALGPLNIDTGFTLYSNCFITFLMLILVSPSITQLTSHNVYPFTLVMVSVEQYGEWEFFFS